jgi:hypothetical protein
MTVGGATIDIHRPGTYEVAHCSREDENITGTSAQFNNRLLPSREESWRLHIDYSWCRTKPALFLKRLKDKAHSWIKWL